MISNCFVVDLVKIIYLVMALGLLGWCLNINEHIYILEKLCVQKCLDELLNSLEINIKWYITIIVIVTIIIPQIL